MPSGLPAAGVLKDVLAKPLVGMLSASGGGQATHCEVCLDFLRYKIADARSAATPAASIASFRIEMTGRACTVGLLPMNVNSGTSESLRRVRFNEPGPRGSGKDYRLPRGPWLVKNAPPTRKCLWIAIEDCDTIAT